MANFKVKGGKEIFPWKINARSIKRLELKKTNKNFQNLFKILQIYIFKIYSKFAKKKVEILKVFNPIFELSIE